MDGCIYRTKDGECDLYAEGGKFIAFCDMDGCKGRRLSNGDKIRAMSDEELAWWISDAQYIQRDPAEWEMWLKSPVEENE